MYKDQKEINRVIPGRDRVFIQFLHAILIDAPYARIITRLASNPTYLRQIGTLATCVRTGQAGTASQNRSKALGPSEDTALQIWSAIRSPKCYVDGLASSISHGNSSAVEGKLIMDCLQDEAKCETYE